MEETHSDVLKDFGSQTEAILKILIVDNSFLKNWKKIVDYLESYTNLSLQLLNDGDLKNAAQVLAKLQNICNEVLKGFPGDVDPERKLSTFFNTKEHTHDREIKLNTGGYIELLQSFISLKDITEIKIPSSFAYYLVLEYFLQITNNIAFISFKRNKIDKALDFLMKVLDCLSLMRFCSYYIKYHLSTVLLNLIFLLDDSHLQDSNQLLVNIILLLEKIETEIDKSKNREPVYTYISERAFCFSFMLE
jgi:tetratricopeptide (TPR) repeat protein